MPAHGRLSAAVQPLTCRWSKFRLLQGGEVGHPKSGRSTFEVTSIERSAQETVSR